jgi:hypothetical protein
MPLVPLTPFVPLLAPGGWPAMSTTLGYGRCSMEILLKNDPKIDEARVEGSTTADQKCRYRPEPANDSRLRLSHTPNSRVERYGLW